MTEDRQPSQPPEGEDRRETAVICIGGGKGGIGKTLLTANLGVCLAKSGHKVVLVDADLGGSNLHTCLGVDQPEVSLADFVQRHVERIEDTIVETGVERLGLISGAQDFLGSANIKYTQKVRALKQIGQIDTDVVLMDLGSGISFNVLDFFLVADLGIIMMMPEPTSVENSYRFIKSAFYRFLRQREKNHSFRKLIEEAMDRHNDHNIKTPADLIREASKLDPERGDTYRAWLSAFRPLLVINQVRDQEDTSQDAQLGQAVRTACRKYLGIDLDYIGDIPYSDSIWKAVRQRKPLVQDNPDSPVAASFWKVARAVADRLGELENPGNWKIG